MRGSFNASSPRKRRPNDRGGQSDQVFSRLVKDSQQRQEQKEKDTADFREFNYLKTLRSKKSGVQGDYGANRKNEVNN